MLVEPTPALPPSPGGRARVLAAIAAPLVLLVAVVASGVLASSPTTEPVPPASPAALGEASLAPAESAAPSAPSATPTLRPWAQQLDLPTRALGLSARTVEETLLRRRDGRIGPELIAVRGWLTIQLPAGDCATNPDAVCASRTILADTSEQLLVRLHGAVDWAGPQEAMHLHPVAMPAVPLPDVGDQELVPIPVVLIGRFEDDRLADPRTSVSHPNEAFVIERVAWSDGWLEPPVVLEAALPPDAADVPSPTDIQDLAAMALESAAVPLSQILIGLDELALLDPEAAGAARTKAAEIGLAEPAAVWYLRALLRYGDPPDSLAGDLGPPGLARATLTTDGILLGIARDE